MAQFLPLLREVLPSAATEIEYNIHKEVSSDGYAYVFHAVKEDTNVMEDDSASPFPSVQVDDDDDYYDGPDDSEYESDNSNAENNPLNDYPDEEIFEDEDEDEDEVMSISSEDKSEGESRTSGSQSEELESGSQASYQYEELEMYDWSDNECRSFL